MTTGQRAEHIEVTPARNCAIGERKVDLKPHRISGTMDVKDQRQRLGRRRHPRGGRRSTDVPGHSPMVLVVDEDPNARDNVEAVLSKLRFAVAPVESVDRAIAVTRALRPAVIVAREKDVLDLRHRAFQSTPIPIVATTTEIATADALVEAVRLALRAPVY